MAKSGTFGYDAGAPASQDSEFLAGVLALARISRVTVALESGTGGAAALLAAAELTGHAETCLLFEAWDGEPLGGLLATAAQAAPEADDSAAASHDGGAQALRRLLQGVQKRRRHSILLIFNRFERFLSMPADDAGYQAFEQAFVELADDRELDLHILLVMDETAEFMLARFEDRIPGIGDGCLRIPAAVEAPGGSADRQLLQPRGMMPRNGRGALTDTADPRSAAISRDRSFGMLLERLTARAPADTPGLHAAPGPSDTPDLPELPELSAPPRQPDPQTLLPDPDHAEPADPGADQRASVPEPMPDPAASPDAGPAAGASRTLEAGPAMQAAQQAQTVTTAAPIRPSVQEAVSPASPAEQFNPESGHQAAAPAKRRGSIAVLAILLAAGAGMLALRQPGPTAGDQPAAADVTPAPAPASASASTPASASAAIVADQPLQAGAPQSGAAQPVPPADAGGTNTPPAASAAPTAASAPSTAAVTPPAGKQAAANTAGTASSPATVYIHVRDARERDRIQSQGRVLSGQGIRLMEVKVMSKGPSVADLRYFHDEDREEALSVQKALLAAGVPVTRLSRMNGFESTTRRRHYEAWLAGESRQAASQR